VSECHTSALLPVADAVPTDPSWLWWARTGAVRLAGMAAPPLGFPFSLLQERGLDAIVSLAGPGDYDSTPLTPYAFDLADLVHGAAPVDSETQAAEVRRAVTTASGLLADGHGVAVHCCMGIGRTGLVIGSVLVAAGHDPVAVAGWLDEVQRARGAPGWPESPWQYDVLATYGTDP
jgi:hypothetical protein